MSTNLSKKIIDQDIIRRNPGNEDIEFNLTLLVTEDCNLRCSYCYEKDKRPKRMPFEVAKSAVCKYLMAESGPTIVNIDFCGGEPMLEFDLIKRIFDYCVSGGPWKKKFRFSIGTNGTILTNDMREWFLDHPCFQIGLSLDGSKEVHDHNRSNSYDTIINNIDFFRKYDQTVKMTISPYSIPRLAECIIHIHDLGMKPEANVVFEDVWGTNEEKENLLNIYAKELDKLVDYYILHPEFQVPKLVGHRIENLVALRKYPLEEKYCGAGRYMVAIMPDGKEYPCHRFSPLGSRTPTQIIDVDKKIIGPGKCVKCEIRALCHSCLGANLEYCGSIDVRTVWHCEFVKLEILASAKLATHRIEQYIENLENAEMHEEMYIRKISQVRQLAESILWIQENVKF